MLLGLFSSPKDIDELQQARQNIGGGLFSGEDIEAVPSSMINTEAIVINDLKKSFKSFGKPPVHAVKGVSLKIYPGEITAILGESK